jgi:glycosyltransferase involved in cell wall biosynthesis
MDTPGRLTIIIPAYNEENSIGTVIAAILAQPQSQNWAVLVVDDGSTDGTHAIAQSFQPRVQVMRHPSNRGYGASLKTGILAARTENVLFIDADGQHDPAQIARLAEELANVECIFTVRPRHAGIPLIRRPGKWFLHRVCNFLANQRIPDINSGFRAGRRHIYMMMLELLPDGFSFATTSLLYVLRSRFSHVFLPTDCRPRVGTSSVRIVYDGLKTILLALRLMLLFDPMRAFGYPAMGLILLGTLYQGFIFLYHLKIVGGSILMVLSGFLLFFIGLIGDQISSLRKEISSFNSLLLEDLQAKQDRRHEG